MKFAAIFIFILEVLLSHAPGTVSGNQSRWLSSMTGVKGGLLRRSMHVLLFLLLSFTAGAAWGWIGVLLTAAWSLLDEVTKIPIPGRHFCLWPDVALNVIGTATGFFIWLIYAKFA